MTARAYATISDELRVLAQRPSSAIRLAERALAAEWVCVPAIRIRSAAMPVSSTIHYAGAIADDAARADVVDDHDRQPRGAVVEHEATRPQFVVNTGPYAWAFSLQVGFELDEIKHQVLARDRYCVAEPNRDFR
jgi:hypothetical protein